MLVKMLRSMRLQKICLVWTKQGLSTELRDVREEFQISTLSSERFSHIHNHFHSRATLDTTHNVKDYNFEIDISEILKLKNVRCYGRHTSKSVINAAVLKFTHVFAWYNFECSSSQIHSCLCLPPDLFYLPDFFRLVRLLINWVSLSMHF